MVGLTPEPSSYRMHTCNCQVVKNRRVIRRLCGFGFFAAMLFAAVSLIGLIAFAGFSSGGNEMGPTQRKLLFALPDISTYTSQADGFIETGVNTIRTMGGTVETTVGGLSGSVEDSVSAIPVPFDTVLGIVNSLVSLGEDPVLTKSPLTTSMSATIGAMHLGDANRISFANGMKLYSLFGSMSGGGGDSNNQISGVSEAQKLKAGLVGDQLGPMLGVSLSAENETLLLGMMMPFVITIVGTLLFCLCFPYIVCMVYSSRICCHCCGSSKPKKKHYSPLLVMLPLVFLILTFGVLISGTVVGIYGDHDVTAGFTTIIDNFPELIPALVSFINEFIDRLVVVLTDEVSTLTNSLVTTIRTATKGLPQVMISRIDEQVNPLFADLDALGELIHSVQNIVPSINVTLNNITVYTDLVKSDLDVLDVQLTNLTTTNWTFFGQVVDMPAAPDISSYKDQIPDVSKFANFDSINAIVDQIPNVTYYLGTVHDSYDMLKNLIKSFENITEPIVTEVEKIQDAGSSTVKQARNLTTALEEMKPSLVKGLKGLKDISISINSVRSIVNLAVFLLPWVAIILCFLPALIFRKPFFLTCMFVLYILCMPLIHLISIPYDLFAIILDDLCVELPNLIPILKQNFGGNVEGLTAGLPIKMNPFDVYEGCQKDVPLGTQLDILDAFGINLTSTVDGFRGTVDDLVVGQIDAFKNPADEMDLSSTFDTVNNMNLTDLDFLGNVSFGGMLDSIDTMLANATNAIDQLTSMKDDLTFSSFNFSYEDEVQPAVDQINSVSQYVGVYYTIYNITLFNSSDPVFSVPPLSPAQKADLVSKENDVRTILERNATAYVLLAQIEGDIDDIQTTVDTIKAVRMPAIRENVQVIENKITAASGSISPLLAYVPSLQNQTETLLANISLMIDETKLTVTQNLLPNVWSAVNGFVNEASNLEGLGHCKFIPTFLDSFLGPEGAICGAFRPGFLALYFAFFIYGIVAFIFLFVVPIASKRIKFLFVSPKVSDGDEYDDIEMESVPPDEK